MLNEKKSGFRVIMIHQFPSEGHLKGEGAVMDTAEHGKIRNY